MCLDDDTPASIAVTRSSSDRTALRHYTDKQKDMEMFDMIAKIKWMINTYPGWSEDGTFTFPDGETWARLETDDED